MIRDNVDAKGKLRILVTGPDGAVKSDDTVNNLVVTAGKNYIADRMKDGGKAQMGYMGVGTDNTAAAIGDTTLYSEAARVALNTAGGTVTDNAVEYSATFGAGVGTGALVEAGIFNDSAAGDLLCRTVYSVVNKGADDTLTITWTVSIN